MATDPLFPGYGICSKPLLRGGICLLPAGHKTKHHTRCVFWCDYCSKTRRGKGPCFLCEKMKVRTRELRRRYG